MKLLFPEKCVLCSAQGPSPCSSCSRLLRTRTDGGPPPSGLDALTTVFAYEGQGRRLITALKYGNRRSSVQWLAAELARSLNAAAFDCVTWVPSSRPGKRQRGYDTGKLLAIALGHRVGLTPRRLLTRSADHPQTDRSRGDRLEGPALKPTRYANLYRSVLVVDDVVTTGASMAVAAEVLRGCGVKRICGAAAAQTRLRST